MLYLDIDNVFADFHKAAREYSGLEEYSNDVWEHIEKVPNFFYKLEVMPNSWQLLAWLDYRKIDYQFLTAMPKPTGLLYQTQPDKVRWVRHHLGSTSQVNCVSHWDQKKYFVQNGKYDILVDDMQRNIDDWESAGGCGVLHTDFDSTIAKLKEIYK